MCAGVPEPCRFNKYPSSWTFSPIAVEVVIVEIKIIDTRACIRTEDVYSVLMEGATGTIPGCSRSLKIIVMDEYIRGGVGRSGCNHHAVRKIEQRVIGNFDLGVAILEGIKQASAVFVSVLRSSGNWVLRIDAFHWVSPTAVTVAEVRT